MGEIKSNIGTTNTSGPGMQTWSVSDDSQFNIPGETREQAYAREQAQQHAQAAFEAQQPQAQPAAQPYNAQPGVPLQMAPQEPRTLQGMEAIEYRRQRIDEANAQAQSDQSSHARNRMSFLAGIGRNTLDVEILFNDEEGNPCKTVFTVRTLKGKEMQRVIIKMNEMTQTNAPDAKYQVRALALGQALVSVDGSGIDMVLGVEHASAADKLEMRMSFVHELDEHVAAYVYARFDQMVGQASSKYSIKTEQDVKEVAEAITKSGQGTGQ